MADQESKVEALEDLPRHNSRIIWFGWCRVREGWTLRRARAIEIDSRVRGGGPVELTGAGRSCFILRTDTAFGVPIEQGWCEMRFLLLRWDDVVGDVFDEDTFALYVFSRRSLTDSVETLSYLFTFLIDSI